MARGVPSPMHYRQRRADTAAKNAAGAAAMVAELIGSMLAHTPYVIQLYAVARFLKGRLSHMMF